MNETDEKVLCVGRELVSGVLDADAPDADKLATLLAGKVYRNRHTPNDDGPDVEHDDRWKQLIPGIVVVNSKGQILTYNRGWNGGEDRLKGKWTCLFGGHVNNEDTTFQTGIMREIREELSGLDVDVLAWAHPDDDDDRGLIHGPIGFIDDNSDDVGRHHLGVVYVLRADEVVPRENPEFEWRTTEEIDCTDRIIAHCENWARLALPIVRKWMESEGK